MRIAFISNNYEPIVSGITVSINSFIDGLEKLGHDVFVFAPSYPGYSERRKNVYRIPSLNIYYKARYPLPIITARSFAQAMRDYSVELIHCHHPFGLGRTALTAARNFLNVPVVFTYHTLYEYYLHYIPLPETRFLKNIVKEASIIYANKCDMVISPTSAIRDRLIELGCRSKIEILPSGISNSLKYPAIQRDQLLLRKFHGIDKNDPVLLCVSRIAKEKNLGFLIKGFSKVINKVPKAKLVVVGDGYLLPKLIKLSNSLNTVGNIIFAGEIPHNEVANYYSIANMLLYTSTTDTQGLPLIEALHFGLPVVAIKSLSSNELVNKLGTGIVTSDSIESFVDGIVKLLYNPAIASRLKDHNLKIAKIFQIDILAKRLERNYLALHSKHYKIRENPSYG